VTRQLFIDAVRRKNVSGPPCFGTGTSIVCRELMDRLGVWFPEAHLDAEKMAALAIAGHTELHLDVVMPLFSVCHEAAALGCRVDWGSPEAMPEPGPPICRTVEDIRIPADLLARSACRVPLEAIRLLRERLGDDAAVCGKVFGGWTLGYHLFGVENFLIGTIDDPAATHRIIEKLTQVAIVFGRAQIEAGADCLLLADHATRDLCSPQAYERFLQEVHDEIAGRLDVPIILHICGETSDRIRMIAGTRLACFHWDTKTGSAEDIRALAGERLSLMGGISNYTLLSGTPQAVGAEAASAIAAGIDVVGPECAVPLGTPLANLQAVAAGSPGRP